MNFHQIQESVSECGPELQQFLVGLEFEERLHVVRPHEVVVLHNDFLKRLIFLNLWLVEIKQEQKQRDHIFRNRQIFEVFGCDLDAELQRRQEGGKQMRVLRRPFELLHNVLDHYDYKLATSINHLLIYFARVYLLAGATRCVVSEERYI